MAITLELTPEIEARLIAQAAAQGMTAEVFLKAGVCLVIVTTCTSLRNCLIMKNNCLCDPLSGNSINFKRY